MTISRSSRTRYYVTHIVSSRLQIAKTVERGLYTDPAPTSKRTRDGIKAATTETVQKKPKGDVIGEYPF